MKIVASERYPKLQFSLRALLMCVALAAIAIVTLQRMESLYGNGRFGGGFSGCFRYTALLGLVAVAGGTLIGIGGARVSFTFILQTRVRVVIWLIFLALVGLTCYCIWAIMRWWLYMGSPPAPLPFPDNLLIAYHDWLDERYPAPPNSVKIHGEFYTVSEHVRWLIAGLSFISGCFLGLLASLHFPQLSKRPQVQPQR